MDSLPQGLEGLCVISSVMFSVKLVKYVQQFHGATHAGVEDFADRFNFLFTVIILVVCCSVVTVKQYFFKPISCYVTSPTGGNGLEEYVENFCWVHGTNPVSLRKELPIHQKDWNALEEEKLVYYYQWVPFVLGLQAIMFYMPRIVWKVMTYNRSRTDLNQLIMSANEVGRVLDKEHRQMMIQHITISLEIMLFPEANDSSKKMAIWRQRIKRLCSRLFLSRNNGIRLITSYMIVKLLYVGSGIGQLIIMHRFLDLGKNTTFFGIDLARNIIAGQDWEQTMVFPRVTFCRVLVKVVGHVNSLTAQCVLPVNMLNEKIYIFLWFWIILATLLSILSIPVWILRIGFKQKRTRFIKKYLQLADKFCSNSNDRQFLKRFVRNFLKQDGVFLLQMISVNAGDMVAAEIISKLWLDFKIKYFNRDFHPQEHISSNLKLQPCISNVLRRTPSIMGGVSTPVEENDEEVFVE